MELEQDEEGTDRPYGRALDLGTGSGIWGIALAKRGPATTRHGCSTRCFDPPSALAAGEERR